MGAIGNSAVLFCAKGSLKTSKASFSEAKTSEASFRLPLLVYNVMSSKSANSGWRAK